MSLRRDATSDAAAVVLIPVLDRPHRVWPVAESALDTADVKVLFIASDGDGREIREIRKAQRKLDRVGLLIVDPRERGDYAFKVNVGVRATGEPWVFQGADDLTFHPGWLDEALRVAAVKNARVIGTQDLCNPRVRSGRHSTHSLVARSYVAEHGTIDEPGKLLHEGYWHGFVDDELVFSARRRGEFAFAPRAVVEHSHPNRGTAPLDPTYEKALDRREFARDRQLFMRRQRLFRRSGRRSRALRSV